jgi:hypothetical protein
MAPRVHGSRRHLTRINILSKAVHPLGGGGVMGATVLQRPFFDVCNLFGKFVVFLSDLYQLGFIRVY